MAENRFVNRRMAVSMTSRRDSYPRSISSSSSSSSQQQG